MIDQARLIDEQTTLRRARLLNIDYEDTASQTINLYPDVLGLAELYDLKVIPLMVSEHNIRFGITNNTSQKTMNDLRQRFADQKISFVLISDSGYRELMHRYDPPKTVIYQDINLNNIADNDQFAIVSKTLNSVRSADMLAYIVSQAYRLKASDIHLENEQDRVRIRLRVDGVLHPIAELARDKYKMLLSSLGEAANISEAADDAQTAHINKSYIMADHVAVNVNLRVETVPALYGMDVVLRLFNLKPELMRLDNLGLDAEEASVLKDIIHHPSGLVLIVGPTGSGKTTTLYSMINELNTPERKIITLEDPVEFYIRGITQIPVNTSNDATGFAEKFRAVLRLDPDVIMVGEIRDNDTAKTALQSALTGHLVLSTYHAASATAALARLLDAIGDNPLFSSAIRLVTAQRLVRRLDDKTKQAYFPNMQVVQWLSQIVNSMPDYVEKPNLNRLQLYQPTISKDNPFGYSGQFAVRELLQMTPNLQQELRRPAHEITTANLNKIAVQDGMLTVLQFAVLKVIAGDTSLEEILRVLDY